MQEPGNEAKYLITSSSLNAWDWMRLNCNPYCFIFFLFFFLCGLSCVRSCIILCSAELSCILSCLMKPGYILCSAELWQTCVGLQLCWWKERNQSHEATGVSATVYHTRLSSVAMDTVGFNMVSFTPCTGPRQCW